MAYFPRAPILGGALSSVLSVFSRYQNGQAAFVPVTFISTLYRTCRQNDIRAFGTLNLKHRLLACSWLIPTRPHIRAGRAHPCPRTYLLFLRSASALHSMLPCPLPPTSRCIARVRAPLAVTTQGGPTNRTHHLTSDTCLRYDESNPRPGIWYPIPRGLGSGNDTLVLVL
jgi:hypothetical protein